MNNLKEGFPPIEDERATILILGSMPSEESLRKKEYYAHPRNAFWKITGELFGFEHDTNYVERTAALKNNNIALWDVMHSCERKGSLDSATNDTTIVVNDFVSFYKSHPNIDYVFFNGAKSENEYLKRVLPILPDELKEIEYCRLPSTSPAMAQLSFNEKLVEWSSLKDKRNKAARN